LRHLSRGYHAVHQRIDMMPLLTAVIPRLNKLAREEGGRQKITQYTRYVTLGLCIFQGGYLLAVFDAKTGLESLPPGH